MRLRSAITPLVLAVLLASTLALASPNRATAVELPRLDREELATQQVGLVSDSRIEGEFTGWTGDTAYRLLNGQVWVQSGYRYEYRYSYNPRVLVFYNYTYQVYLMVVDNDYRNVTVVAPATHALISCIQGTFNGWSGQTVFSLCNGQIWVQSTYAYTYHYAYRPDVLIFSTDSGQTYRMKIEGVADTIGVARLR